MKSKLLYIGIAILALSALIGCGGGGGSSSAAPAAAPAKNTSARARLIATTRVSRAVLAVTGLGRNITRAASTAAIAPTTAMGSRIPLFFALHATRSSLLGGRAATRSSLLGNTPGPPSGIMQDPSTGLYFTVTVNSDGSGEELLYTDPEGTTPAGSFIWNAPHWTGGIPNHYPAVIRVTYNITAGNFAGDNGTLIVNITDPSFENGLITLVLNDAMHESANASFSLVKGNFSGNNAILLAGGDSCNESFVQTAAAVGDISSSVFKFPDGCFGDINVQPDGTETESYTNSSGTVEATGTVQPNGDDAIIYDTTASDSSGSSSSSGSSGSTDTSGSSGSSDSTSTEDVNVDTGDDSSDDSGDDGGDDGGDDSMAVKRTHWLSIPSTRATTKQR